MKGPSTTVSTAWPSWLWGSRKPRKGVREVIGLSSETQLSMAGVGGGGKLQVEGKGRDPTTSLPFS